MIEPGAQRCRARQDERRVCHSSARDQGRARGLQLLEGLVVARQVDRPQGCCVFFGAVSGECTMTFLRSAEDGWAQAPVRALWKSGAAPCQTLVHLEAISWGGPVPAHPVKPYGVQRSIRWLLQRPRMQHLSQTTLSTVELELELELKSQ